MLLLLLSSESRKLGRQKGEGQAGSLLATPSKSSTHTDCEQSMRRRHGTATAILPKLATSRETVPGPRTGKEEHSSQRAFLIEQPHMKILSLTYLYTLLACLGKVYEPFQLPGQSLASTTKPELLHPSTLLCLGLSLILASLLTLTLGIWIVLCSSSMPGHDTDLWVRGIT